MLRIMTIFVIWGFGGHDGDEERRGKRARRRRRRKKKKKVSLLQILALQKNLAHLGQIRVKLAGRTQVSFRGIHNRHVISSFTVLTNKSATTLIVSQLGELRER